MQNLTLSNSAFLSFFMPAGRRASADLGVDLGSRLEVELNVPSRLKSLLSTVKSVLSGTVCFMRSRLHNEKYVSCTCSPPLLLILLIFTFIV